MNEEDLQRSNLEMFLQICKRQPKKRTTPKEHCKQMLEDLGVTVEYIFVNRGYWAMRQQDCYRWEWGGTMDGLSICGGCWDSMKDCVKAGKLAFNEDHSEVSAVDKRSSI